MMSQEQWRARDEQLRQERAEVAELANKYQLPLPWGPYQAAPLTCYRCHARIIVYTWLGHSTRSTEPPPSPRPRTLQERATQQSGGMRYWLNTCSQCRATQGDNYLYDEAGASGPPPFKSAWRSLPAVPGGDLPWSARQAHVGASPFGPVPYLFPRLK